LFACFIFETTEQLLKFVIENLHQKLSSEFNLGLYWSNITPTLHEVQI